jgi:hypothetical protein
VCWRRSRRQSLGCAQVAVFSSAVQAVRDIAHELGFLQTSRTVRACAEATEFTNSTWISLLRGTPSGRRDHLVCLRIGRPPKMSLNDVEPERCED